jgi:transposase
VPVFFFDEARFGLRPSVGRRWARRGSRPVAVVRTGYLNFYAYSAVCPETGEDFTLRLSHVRTDVMNIFLREMAASLGGRECILVMDRAGWHVSKDLVVPPNIRIVLLPPYSPELNPVERLWQWVKRHAIRNRLFKCLEEVEVAVDKCLESMTPDFLRGICRCNYLLH